MKWNVYVYNINKKKIEIYNIFEHGGFNEYVNRYIKECKTKDEFAEQLLKELFYYYGYKAEWEIIIAPWVGGDREKEAVKIDVYSQVVLNWDLFVDYCWSNKKELLNE